MNPADGTFWTTEALWQRKCATSLKCLLRPSIKRWFCACEADNCGLSNTCEWKKMENTGITFYFSLTRDPAWILCVKTKPATDSVFKLTLTNFCHWLSAKPAWKKLDILHHMTVAQFHFSFLPLCLGSWKCVLFYRRRSAVFLHENRLVVLCFCFVACFCHMLLDGVGKFMENINIWRNNRTVRHK